MATNQSISNIHNFFNIRKKNLIIMDIFRKQYHNIHAKHRKSIGIINIQNKNYNNIQRNFYF